MAYKRNPGKFNKIISVLKPSEPIRDELGGIASTTYKKSIDLYAMVEQRNQTRQQIIGDYVTVDTRFFVVRDIRAVLPDINTQWRLEYNGYTYIINDLTLIEESRPYYVQITATAINAGGGLV